MIFLGLHQSHLLKIVCRFVDFKGVRKDYGTGKYGPGTDYTTFEPDMGFLSMKQSHFLEF